MAWLWKGVGSYPHFEECRNLKCLPLLEEDYNSGLCVALTTQWCGITWHSTGQYNQTAIICTIRYIYFNRKLAAEGALSLTISENVQQ
jgi:hypothetical protein